MQILHLDKSLITLLTPSLHHPGTRHEIGIHRYLKCVRLEIYEKPLLLIK